MDDRPALFRRSLAIAGLAAVTLTVAAGHLRLLSQPPARILGTVPDDAFYYLQIARHLAAGHGSTFDGVHPTSGYHPGWMALLVPLAALLPDPGSLLRGALALAFLLHAAAAAVLGLLFRRFTSPGLAAIGALCWLANPFALHLAFLGLESALYMLSLALVLWATAVFLEGTGSARSHAGLGAALALCFLARTEAGILALLTCAAAPAFRGSRPLSRPWLRSGLLIGIPFTLGVLPWFLYCWRATGSPWQTSGVAKSLWAAAVLRPLSPPERLAHLADAIGRIWLVPPWSVQDDRFLNPFVCAAILPALAGLLMAVRRPEERPLIAGTAWLMGITVLTAAVYGLFYWEIPLWYRAQPALLIFVISYVWTLRAGAFLADRPWGRLAAVSVPAVLLAFSLIGAISFHRHPPVTYPWQPGFYSSQAAFERLVPPGQAIGCFNAGIPAFFGRRRIVNLDGLVNSSVVPYYRNHDLGGYLDAEGLRYVADDTTTVRRAAELLAGPLRLRELACVPLSSFADRRCLWRVE